MDNENTSLEQENTILSWDAPGRPYREKKKQYFLNVLVIMVLIEIILFLFSQYILMVLVVALVFLTFSLSLTKPRNFNYKITTEGIKVEDYFFIWEELYDFRFKIVEGQAVLILNTKVVIPGELILTLGEMHQDHVKSILINYLPYREYVKPEFTERAGNWLSKNFPVLESNR